MPWWAWLVLGFALLGGELLAPGGLYLLFAGIGALIVGLLTVAGMSGPDWTQWLLFVLVSGLSVATLRSRLAPTLRAGSPGDNVVGEMVELTTPIEPDGVGQGRLRGSTWKVQNAGSGALEAGARCRVDEINGITLSVGNPPDELEEIDRWN